MMTAMTRNRSRRTGGAALCRPSPSVESRSHPPPRWLGIPLPAAAFAVCRAAGLNHAEARFLRFLNELNRYLEILKTPERQREWRASCYTSSTLCTSQRAMASAASDGEKQLCIILKSIQRQDVNLSVFRFVHYGTQKVFDNSFRVLVNVIVREYLELRGFVLQRSQFPSIRIGQSCGPANHNHALRI
jgi:hypothetical protein